MLWTDLRWMCCPWGVSGAVVLRRMGKLWFEAVIYFISTLVGLTAPLFYHSIKRLWTRMACEQYSGVIAGEVVEALRGSVVSLSRSTVRIQAHVIYPFLLYFCSTVTKLLLSPVRSSFESWFVGVMLLC